MTVNPLFSNSVMISRYSVRPNSGCNSFKSCVSKNRLCRKKINRSSFLFPHANNVEQNKIPINRLIFIDFEFLQIVGNVYVYELWRVPARTSPKKNWLWKIRRFFQVGIDQAIAY